MPPYVVLPIQPLTLRGDLLPTYVNYILSWGQPTRGGLCEVFDVPV